MTEAAQFNPFPGLRPFKTEERFLFFGREGQSDAILRRLRDNRFVVLVGPSGSGKSSLINAGLLPYLSGGFLGDAGSFWRIAKCRPGSDPIGNLAHALCEPTALGLAGTTSNHHANDVALMDVTLRGSSLGLVDAVRLARLAPHEQVLVIIDQFEELFRFADVSEQKSGDEDAAALVKVLLEAVRQRDLPIFIVLGLRSDYIGDCARFRDLPEAVMPALFLIPRMTRDGQRQAIEGPVRVGDANIAPRLVSRLLNDVGDNPDQLPILQHALMRTWDHWQASGENERAIDLSDYDAIGGMAKALSIYADDAYKKLPDEQSRDVAKLAFRCLSGKDVNSREARRPATVATIAGVANVSCAALIKVINQFRQPDRAFLTPPWDIDVNENTVIDIAHESLICGWYRLKNWVEEEAEAAKEYIRLAEAAARHAAGREGLWHEPELQIALAWRQRWLPNDDWAQRYDPGFAQAMRFLDKSRDARDALKRADERQRRATLGGVIVASCIVTAAGIFAWRAWDQANADRVEKLQTRSELLAGLAEQWTRAGDVGAALPLAIDLLPTDPTKVQIPAAELQIENAIRHLHERLVLSATTDPVRSATFSPDGGSIVTASADGLARLWNATTGEPTGIEFAMDGGASVNDVSFNPNGSQIATASDDGMLRLWDPKTGAKIMERKERAGPVIRVAFGSKGKRILTLHSDGAACVWDASTLAVICTPDPQGQVTSGAFSPDDANVATGFVNGSVTIWKAETMTPVITPSPIHHSGSITGVAYSPDGKRIVTSSSDETWAVWDVDTGRSVFPPVGAVASLESLAISGDGKHVVTGSADNTIQIWDLATGKMVTDPLVTELRPSENKILHIAFGPNNARFVTASSDGTARVWDVEVQMNTPQLLKGHTQIVRAATFSPDGNRIVTASDDRTVRLWNIATGSVVRRFELGVAVHDAKFSPNGKLIVAALGDGTVSIWDADTGLQVGEPLKAPERDGGPVDTAVFNPEGNSIAVAYDKGSAWIWDIGTRKTVGPLGAGGHGARSAVFNHDGKLVLTAHRDGAARIWDSTSGKLVANTPTGGAALRSAAFSRDEKLIVTASADGMQIWDAPTLKAIGTFAPGSGVLYSAVFSPNGNQVLTASHDGNARLLDPKTGELVDEPFKTSGGELYGAAFAPDGKRIAIPTAEGIVQIWPIFESVQMLVTYAKTVAPRCLSVKERRTVTQLTEKQDQWCIDLKKWSPPPD